MANKSLITQDFEFKPLSAEFGKFLVECYQTQPGIEIKRLTGIYPYKKDMEFYTIEATEELAVVLKLIFGSHLRTRPAPTNEEIDEKKLLDFFKNNNLLKKKPIQNTKKSDYIKYIRDYEEKDEPHWGSMKKFYNIKPDCDE